MAAEYYPDAVDLIMKQLRTHFGGYFHAYYEGDPEAIPKVNLPAIIVRKLRADYRFGATGQDNILSTIGIVVVMDKLEDIGASADVDLTSRKLRRICEGRNATTGQYLDNSVVGMFRRQITLDDNETILQSDTNVDYDERLRPDDVITAEAYITVFATEKVNVTDRR